MNKMEIKFVNGENLTMEGGTNYSEVLTSMENSPSRFFTIDDGKGNLTSINLDNIVAIIVD